MADHKCKATKVKVGCGRITLGDTVSIPIGISRDNFTLTQADHFLCDAQIDITLTRDPGSDADVDGQQKLPGHKPISMAGVASVGSVSVKAKAFRATLSFAGSTVAEVELSRFANREATLHVKRVGNAEKPAGEPADADPTDEQRDAAIGQLRIAPDQDTTAPKKGPATKTPATRTTGSKK